MGEPLDFWHHISSNLSFGIFGSSYISQSPPSGNIAALILEARDPTENPNLHMVSPSPHWGPEPVYRMRITVSLLFILENQTSAKKSQEDYLQMQAP